MINIFILYCIKESMLCNVAYKILLYFMVLCFTNLALNARMSAFILSKKGHLC